MMLTALVVVTLVVSAPVVSLFSLFPCLLTTDNFYLQPKVTIPLALGATSVAWAAVTMTPSAPGATPLVSVAAVSLITLIYSVPYSCPN